MSEIILIGAVAAAGFGLWLMWWFLGHVTTETPSEDDEFEDLKHD